MPERIILPRQAWDKHHKGSAQKTGVRVFRRQGEADAGGGRRRDAAVLAARRALD